MSEHLHRDVMQWLLEPDNPSVRYLTLRDLLGLPEDDPKLRAAQAAIPQSQAVTRIFEHQAADGHWGDPATPYAPMYKGSYWTLMILAHLGLSCDDHHVQRAVDYLSRFQQPLGGFGVSGEEGAEREYERVAERQIAKGKTPADKPASFADYIHQMTLSCLTGNVVTALLRLGYVENPRVWRAVDWLLSIQTADGGWLCPYRERHIRDTHSCFHGTICALEAFGEIPKNKRPPEVQAAIAGAAEFLLVHHLYRADHHRLKVINPTWQRLAFPWFYHYSILRGLWVLTQLGIDDPRMDDARSVLRDKRTPDGTWILESTPYRRMLADLGKKGDPSKWITLKALQVLR